MQEEQNETNLTLKVRQNFSLVDSQDFPVDFTTWQEIEQDIDLSGISSSSRLEYSHFGTFHGIPCYFNVETEGITGRGAFNCFLMDTLIFIGRVVPGIGRVSKIVIGAELDRNNLYH